MQLPDGSAPPVDVTADRAAGALGAAVVLLTGALYVYFRYSYDRR